MKVPYPVEDVRRALADAERVRRCVPGAQSDAGGDGLSGRLRLRIAGSTITYRGELRVEPRTHGVRLEAQGREARGNGGAEAVVDIVAEPDPSGGTVLHVTGSVTAQGRLAEVDAQTAGAAGRRLLDRFLNDLLPRERPAGPSARDTDAAVAAGEAPADVSPQADVPQAEVPTEVPEAVTEVPGAEVPEAEVSEAEALQARALQAEADALDAEADALDAEDEADALRAEGLDVEGLDIEGIDPEASQAEELEAEELEAEDLEAEALEAEVEALEAEALEAEAEIIEAEVIEAEAERAAAEGAGAPAPAEMAPVEEPLGGNGRRTMIGRSAEEVDHAPPQGRYAPVANPTARAAVSLRWAGPAAAALVASAVVVGRALRRRR
ncbi:hypothetical protein AQ490_26835 [Wenjunlia vitaminophila]|uniref:Carbon monoxide dehydrogenase subunit G n=1 Tax=Wenjunlia vitaminophila TaxID=76728 RepID=A0A0T6LPN9_WENVI|nr:hypothetical protein AQ490_26835 [Wenjunlia vitaminophila]